MSIGAEIVRLMQDRMGVAVGYFYDDYPEGSRSYADYSMAQRREDRERDDLKLSVADLQVQFRKLLEEIAAIRQEFATERREHAETKRALAEAQSRKPRPVRPR